MNSALQAGPKRLQLQAHAHALSRVGIVMPDFALELDTGGRMQMRRTRRQTGQAVVATMFGMAFLIVGVVGFFVFDLIFASLAREQLRTACEAAAVAGAATMAGSDDTNTSAMQTQALNNAMQVFRMEQCVGKSLQNAIFVGTSNSSTNPSANQCFVAMQFLNPNNNNQPVTIGDPNGKILQVTATYGMLPAFAQYVNLKTVPLITSSQAGVPMMDIVMVFDVSASIDDQTPVTFVKRYYDSTANAIVDGIVSTSGGSPAGPLAEGTIYNILGPQPVGTGCNAIYPQDLISAGIGNQYPLYFSEYPGFGPNSATGLRGTSNTAPPGNLPVGLLNKVLNGQPLPPGQGSKVAAAPAGTGGPHTFTDEVVNIDGNNQFSGFTYGGYNFPNVATLVEAARGNLENQAVYTKSGASSSAPNVTPKPGYQSTYFQLAKQNVHPLGDAQKAAQTFFSVMNNDTNAHFGFVGFSSQAGAGNSSGSSTWYNVDEYYPQAGQGQFPIPVVQLNPQPTQTNYSQIISAIPTTTAYGGTNIGDGVYAAVQMLKQYSRAGSKKAIVLFTDGQPTMGGPLDGDPWNNARLAAQAAKSAGIPVYTVGLAQNSAIQVGENSILNDWDSNAQTGGIAAISGNGAKYFLVTDVKQLRSTFENLARTFVQMIKA